MKIIQISTTKPYFCIYELASGEMISNHTIHSKAKPTDCIKTTCFYETPLRICDDEQCVCARKGTKCDSHECLCYDCQIKIAGNFYYYDETDIKRFVRICYLNPTLPSYNKKSFYVCNYIDSRCLFDGLYYDPDAKIFHYQEDENGCPV